MNPPKHLDSQFIREPNYSQLQGKCLEEEQSKNCSLLPDHKLLVQKKKFNDSLLPKHVGEKTIFGIETKSKCNIADVIFPNRLFREKFVEEESKTESYKNFHHTYEIGQQLNRRYSSTFDPHYRYGKTLKLLPPGMWFKNYVKYESPKENPNDITEYKSKLLESEENKKCHGRYPVIDNRQGKFMGRSYLRAVDILNRSYPDKKEYEFFDYLSAVNKIKYAAKKQKCDLRELRETYNLLDKELTGWLPLEQVYAICYRYKLKPDKQLFDLALNSIRAVNENSVRYDLFVDLLDPNVKFTPVFEKDTKTEHNRFVATYQNDYENRFSQSVQLNKKDDSLSSYACCVKPAINHLDCLGFETTAKALLNPSIFTNYGITHRDFYIGRSKEVMKKLFYDIGMNLPDDFFNVVWDNAYQREGFDVKVSVEIFRQVLQELISKK